MHGVGAPPGTILAGIFCSPQLGIFSGNGSSDGVSSTGGQLGIQAMCVLATALYTLVASFIILKVVDAPVGLRVNEEEETRGLDMVLHDERGYDL